jgi:hypothetical protein
LTEQVTVMETVTETETAKEIKHVHLALTRRGQSDKN